MRAIPGLESAGGGGGHFILAPNNFFLNFIIKRVNIHGLAPSSIFWEHVKERKITKFGVIGTVRPPPQIRIFIILESFYFSAGPNLCLPRRAGHVCIPRGRPFSGRSKDGVRFRLFCSCCRSLHLLPFYLLPLFCSRKW